RPQLGDVVATQVRYPDVGPVERYTLRPDSRAEGSEHTTIARAQLGHRVAPRIGHPDVGPVKGQPNGLNSHAKRPQHGAGSPELGDGIAAVVRHPDVGAVGDYGGSEVADRKDPEHGAIAHPQLGHAALWGAIRHPDVRPVKGHAKGSAYPPESPKDPSI